jgi:uncharacterized protein YukE
MDQFADDSFGLKQLYEQVNDGPGSQVVTPSAEALNKFAPVMTGSSQRIQDAVRRTGVSWQGQAADATAASIQQLGQWSTKGGQVSGAGGGQIHSYADSFESFKRQVKPPVLVRPLTTWDTIHQVLGAGSDHAIAIQRNQQAASAAYEALGRHEQTTNQAIGAFPDIEQVPKVTNPASVTLQSRVTGPGAAGGPSAALGTAPRAGGPGAGKAGAPAGTGGTSTGAGKGGAPHSTGTMPGSWTPLTSASPTDGAGGTGGMGGVPPTSTGGDSRYHSSLQVLPPPITGGPHGGYGGEHRGNGAGLADGPGARPPVPRGGVPLPERMSGMAATGGELGAAGPAGRSGMSGSMPIGGAGAGLGGQGKEHRNNSYISSVDLFNVDDEVSPPVIGMDRS